MTDTSVTTLLLVKSYIWRLKEMQTAQNEDITRLYELKDELLTWDTEWDLDQEPEWREMERRLNHINNTYQRL